MDIQFDENDIAVDQGTFRVFAFVDDRPVTCFAPLGPVRNQSIWTPVANY